VTIRTRTFKAHDLEFVIQAEVSDDDLDLICDHFEAMLEMDSADDAQRMHRGSKGTVDVNDGRGDDLAVSYQASAGRIRIVDVDRTGKRLKR
jgi:hypothetical protein